MKKGIKIIAKSIGIFVLSLVALCLLATVVTMLENNTKGAGTNETYTVGWMADLPDDVLLSEINIPGTHDSATQYVQLSFFSKCQGKNIYKQLRDGYRYLDIRLGDAKQYCEDAFALVHGFTNCKEGALPWSKTLYLDRVLTDCYMFLEEHPSETVVFVVKHEHGDMPIAQVQELLNSYVAENPEKWLLTDTIPTLGEARGKLVLVRRYEDEAGLGQAAGLQVDWGQQSGHNDISLASEATVNAHLTAYVQDRYEYGSKDKWNAFVKGIEETQGLDERESICINFLSTKGTLAYGHPYSHARKLNAQLLEEDWSDGTRLGWVVMDFGNAQLAREIYETNFH